MSYTAGIARPGSDRALVEELREANQKLVVAALEAERAAASTALDMASLAEASQHDVLTGVFNRKSIKDTVDNAIRMASRSHSRLALLFVDLDDFKAVNDRFGHTVGDQVLQTVARTLERAVRNTDTVGRYGGDEFVVLLSPIAWPADASIIAAKINAALAAAVLPGVGSLSISASVGVALYPHDGTDGETLIDLADSAMYRSKRDGHGCFACHSEWVRKPTADDGSDVLAVRADTTRQIVSRQSPLLHRDLVDANEQLVVTAMALQQAGGLAEEMRLRQLRFMAMVGHEMRDPLGPLRNAADLLGRLRGGDERLMGKARDIITRQVDRLSRLVEDLIDGSRVSTGQFRLRISPVELVTLLNLAVDACRLHINDRQQALSLELPLSIQMQGDPVRLMQIFINLLENAAKYTPDGGAIRLGAKVCDQQVIVTIADNGIGIGAETLSHVFDMFVQEPSARARRDGGLGIGLAIVRELVEAHGGTVTAKSDGANLGSQFVVTLPVGVDESTDGLRRGRAESLDDVVKR